MPNAMKNRKPWRQVGCLLPVGCVLTVGFSWADDGVPVPPLDAGLMVLLHPVCVHFAVALVVLGCSSTVVEALVDGETGNRPVKSVFSSGLARWVWLSLSGWIEQQLPQPNSVFDPQVTELLFYHEYGGYALLGFFIILLVARLQIRGPLPLLYIILAGMGLVGLTIQGYWGGEMVYRYGAGVRAVQVLSAAVAEPSAEKPAPDDPR